MPDPDLATELARRDRYLRELARRMSPQERLARADQMYQDAMATLRSNPEAYRRYLARQYHARRDRGPDYMPGGRPPTGSTT